MKRRNFLKSTALGAAFISTTGVYAMQDKSKKELVPGMLCLSRPNGKIPVIFETDVVVLGASAAGIMAAVEAARKGSRVLVISQDPYLGWDVAGTLRLWKKQFAFPDDFIHQLFGENQVISPQQIKKALDNLLIDNNIPFLLSSYPSQLLFDGKKNLAGLVIANRSGEQAIRANIIIDTTQLGLAAKLSGAAQTEEGSAPRLFSFTTIGKTSQAELSHEILTPGIQSEELTYDGFRYTFEPGIPPVDMNSLSLAEHKIRGLVWDEYQVDSADYMDFVTSFSYPCLSKQKAVVKTPGEVDLRALNLKNCEQIFILGTAANISREAAGMFLDPSYTMQIGKRLGAHVADSGKIYRATEILFTINGKQRENAVLSYSVEPVRPAFLQGEITLDEETLPLLGKFDVVVAGGGTAGACAGIAAGRNGMKTLVVEYLHGLGGTGTTGLITRYFDGYREGFTREIDDAIEQMGPNNPRKKAKRQDWVKDWKMEWFRTENLKAATSIWFGCIVCGAVLEGKVVKGIVVSTPYGKGAVLADKVIDSSGSADVSIAAGAAYKFVDTVSDAVQGSGIPPIQAGVDYINSDWTFISDTDVFDITNSFTTAREKFKNSYDVGKLLQTRERRRIVGEHEVSVLDILNVRPFKDALSYHISSFDTHGFIIDPYFIIKPPRGRHVIQKGYVPLRSMLPVSLENIIVTGLGISAHRDAMPVLRMQPCVQNQGYAAGLLAALCVRENKTFREYPHATIQQKLLEMNILPADFSSQEEVYPPAPEILKSAIDNLDAELSQLELILWDTKTSLELIHEKYPQETDSERKLQYAFILGVHGIDLGWELLRDKVKTFTEWDKGWNYKGMGQFGPSLSPLDSLIIALGRTKKEEAIELIHDFAGKLTPDSHFSHFRAIALALEAVHSVFSVPVLAKLLSLEGISGYAVTSTRESFDSIVDNINDTTYRNKSLKEIYLARALYLCGDKDEIGFNILSDYRNDLRGYFARFANSVITLKRLK